MWALRAAVRPGLRLSRVGRARPIPRAAPPPPCPVRALAATGRCGRGGREEPGSAGRSKANGRTIRAGEDEEEPEDEEEEEEEEEEELLRSEPLLPAGTQRVCLVHPEVKWGAGKLQLTRAEWQVAEATALVHTLAGWSVAETMVVPTKTPDRKLIFGKGNLEHLTERIRGSPEITCVFLNVERLTPATRKELEAAWRVPVFDRFTIVLHIFRRNARTKEARLQVALAEIPLLRSNLKNEVAVLDRGGGGSRYLMGSGKGSPSRRCGSASCGRRRSSSGRPWRGCAGRGSSCGGSAPSGSSRSSPWSGTPTAPHPCLTAPHSRRPVYTSPPHVHRPGKTTLIRALTGDVAMQPRDQLFATLDVTAHAGSLPSRMTVLYVDTIGFLSQLPHDLIESFSATLEDVAHSDVVMHVRDVSHPETELHKASVLSALRGLGLPAPLLDSVVEVHNKVDLVPGYRPPDPSTVAVSALRGRGLDQLRATLEDAVLRATGRQVLTLHVKLAGPQLSWLYREATVQQVDVLPEAGAAHVKVIISNSAYGKFRKLFPG
ncbi:putative GTP-binding protein 6 isoform X2 [Sciurus carolinensis]|uniref:putative GTP-binding protein 6 isoform X2 n=1 Tax=Sciurus carolinensis TaxID=30640 RepID=UPI001FB3C3F1|nr:putative GTP-binding protein 6 isoform X2 [Sciurus carolinensis]